MEEFEVIFLDEDKKTELDKQKVTSGSKVIYHGKEPFKEPENGITYTFEGWTDEDKLENVTENLVVVARFVSEVKISKEEALLNASLENAQGTSLSSALESSKKIYNHQKAIEKDSRTAEQIVKDILENGKTVVGQELNRDDER